MNIFTLIIICLTSTITDKESLFETCTPLKKRVLWPNTNKYTKYENKHISECPEKREDKYHNQVSYIELKQVLNEYNRKILANVDKLEKEVKKQVSDTFNMLKQEIGKHMRRCTVAPIRKFLDLMEELRCILSAEAKKNILGIQEETQRKVDLLIKNRSYDALNILEGILIEKSHLEIFEFICEGELQQNIKKTVDILVLESSIIFKEDLQSTIIRILALEKTICALRPIYIEEIEKTIKEIIECQTKTLEAYYQAQIGIINTLKNKLSATKINERRVLKDVYKEREDLISRIIIK